MCQVHNILKKYTVTFQIIKNVFFQYCMYLAHKTMLFLMYFYSLEFIYLFIYLFILIIIYFFYIL